MSDTLPDTALRISRRLPVSHDRVFAAWSRPEALRHWFCTPGDGYRAKSVDLDFEVGGSYRATMRNPQDVLLSQFGDYVDIQVPNRLVFTMTWDPPIFGDDLAETLVAVSFAEIGDVTKLTLTQVGFPDDTVRDEHVWGWEGCLDALERYLARKTVG
jgi:uncharacterized protein YndB with AHSA1/START domain